MLNSDMPAHEKSIPRLVNEGLVMIGAGTVTTAHVLSRTLYHILANPPVLARLQRELQDAFPDNAPLSPKETLVQLDRLPYLGAVIKEGLRLSHAITHRNGRVAPDRALQYQDWTIPPGTVVSMTAFLVHIDPAIFPEPQQFLPERWLKPADSKGESEGEGGKAFERYLLPFNRGSRICLGMNLADAEVKMTLAAVIRRFELELFETERGDVDAVHDFIAGGARLDSKGVRVVIRKRK